MQGSEDVGTNVPALGYHSLTWGLRDCVFLVGGEGGKGGYRLGLVFQGVVSVTRFVGKPRYVEYGHGCRITRTGRQDQIF